MRDLDTKNTKTSTDTIGKFSRIISVVVLCAFIFALGVQVGNGKLVINTHPFKSKTVSSNLPQELDYASVQKVYDTIRSEYDGKLDSTQLMDGLKHGLAEATGDPYTTYFSAKEAKNFNDQLNGTFSGIGAELSKDTQGNLIVVSPIAGFPADKAGLKPKDIIAGINSKSTTGLSIDAAVTMIRGPKNTEVKLLVIRNGQQVNISIIRDDIKIPSVNSKILDNNIGYLQISQFSSDTTELATKAALQFKQSNVKGIILDMRGDPGGLLDAAVNISSLWLPEGKTVLQEKRDDVVVNNYKANGNSPLQGIPTVVLMNGGSASASEITAGALRDNNAAILLGEKSFGKGSVQQIIDLKDGSEVKVTIAHWFTPNGKTINKTGLQPDQVVTISDDDIKNARDPQKDAAIVYLSKK
ncbi:MAG: hypothetical protein NVSMB46_08810 [Candidatus Saccharimonadales bacterium]